jgi:hypothetical protein
MGELRAMRHTLYDKEALDARLPFHKQLCTVNGYSTTYCSIQAIGLQFLNDVQWLVVL